MASSLDYRLDVASTLSNQVLKIFAKLLSVSGNTLSCCMSTRLLLTKVEYLRTEAAGMHPVQLGWVEFGFDGVIVWNWREVIKRNTYLSTGCQLVKGPTSAFFIGIRELNSLLKYIVRFIHSSAKAFWISNQNMLKRRWAWAGVNSWGTSCQLLLVFQSLWRFRTIVDCEVSISADNLRVLVAIFSSRILIPTSSSQSSV